MSRVMQISALVIVVAVMIIVATYTGRDDSFEPAQVDSAAPTVQLPTTPTGTVIPDSLASTGPEETAATPTGVNPHDRSLRCAHVDAGTRRARRATWRAFD